MFDFDDLKKKSKAWERLKKTFPVFNVLSSQFETHEVEGKTNFKKITYKSLEIWFLEANCSILLGIRHWMLKYDTWNQQIWNSGLMCLF